MSISTIKDVSQRAGVSISTVSRVLNNSGPASAETRRKVLKAVEQLGYKPNALARGLATQRTGGIGVMINSLSSPFFSRLLQGIENIAEAHHMHLLVANGRADAKREQTCAHYLYRNADAVIGFFEAISDEMLITLSQTYPLVVIGRHIVDIASRCVYLDNEHGGYIATQHLLDQGHHRIAHISGPLHLPDSRARLQGYRQALAQAGIAYDERLVYEGEFSEHSGQMATERLLNRDATISAIFAANDQTAAGALKMLWMKGLHVPDDLSLIGYDDIIICNYLNPTLTTIKQPLLEMGEAAATIAMAQLKHTTQEVRHKFEPKLVKRKSVARVLQH